MSDPVAFNAKTGKALRLSNGEWVETQAAKNPAGDVVVFDGAGWKPVKQKAAQPEAAPVTEVEPGKFRAPLRPGSAPVKEEQGVLGTVNEYVNKTGTALTKGATNLLGLPQAVAEGAGSLGALATEAMGYDPEAFRDAYGKTMGGMIAEHAPTAKGMQDAVFNDLGVPNVEPEGGVERILFKGIEALPGGAAGKIPAAINFAAGASGQTAEEGVRLAGKDEWAPYAHLVGALVGGGGAASMASKASKPVRMAGDATQSITPAQWQQAQALQREASQRGINLTAGEALEQVTGHKGLTALQDAAAQSMGGRATMARAYQNRPEEVRRAVDQGAKEISPTVGNDFSPMALNNRAQTAARGAINDARGARSAATKPFYDAAASEPLSRAQVGGLLRVVDNELLRTARGSASYQELTKLKALIQQNADNATVGKMDEIYKQARERLGRPQMDPNAVRAGAEAKVGSVVSEIGEKLKGYSGSLAAGRAEHQRMTPMVERVKALTKSTAKAKDSPAGKMAQKMLSDPDTVNPLDIRAVSALLNKKDPTVTRDLMAAYIRGAFEKAAKPTQQGEQMYSGANLAKAIYGAKDSKTRMNIREAIRSIPGGDAEKRVKGFDNLMEVLQATGKAPRVGSQTQPRQEITSQMGGGSLAGDMIRSAPQIDKGSVLGAVTKRWNEMVMNKNFGRLAEALTEPDSVRKLQQLAVLNPRSAKAQLVVAEILAAQRAGAVE